MLSSELMRVGHALGRDVRVVVSDMDQPLGMAVGNSLEVDRGHRDPPRRGSRGADRAVPGLRVQDAASRRRRALRGRGARASRRRHCRAVGLWRSSPSGWPLRAATRRSSSDTLASAAFAREPRRSGRDRRIRRWIRHRRHRSRGDAPGRGPRDEGGRDRPGRRARARRRDSATTSTPATPCARCTRPMLRAWTRAKAASGPRCDSAPHRCSRRRSSTRSR